MECCVLPVWELSLYNAYPENSVKVDRHFQCNTYVLFLQVADKIKMPESKTVIMEILAY